ncbi:Intramembrane protease RasP/YluC, implicated in cell division based on FtsL cleavage [hydrothermal vent metagenome]|uniref:Intramembrane protease RasP/YluC, implicated in cell division based on FtsL cleavage n=1 Tax=hydrothermal vent metagenome TaxID=652676 RepID=A0A3B0X0D1_9ZZZZ
MDILNNILFFIIAIGILVAFHEFGHYWVARLLKVKVLRFSIGFGKPLFIWRKQRGEDLIEFVVAAIPLGGYVKMLDEREAPVDEKLKHRAFNNQSLSTRFAIVAAGPIFNFILAIFFYFIFFANGESGLKALVASPPAESVAAQAGFEDRDEILSVAGKEVKTWQDFRIALIDQGIDGGNVAVKVRTVDLYEQERLINIGDRHILNEKDDVTRVLGFSPWYPVLAPRIGAISKKSAAASAGLQANDLVLSIDGQSISAWGELVKIVQSSAGKPLKFLIERNTEQKTLTLTPEEKQREGKLVGFMGASPDVPDEFIRQNRVKIEYSLGGALYRGAEETWMFSVLMLKVLGKMIIGQAALENISGPITIAQYAGITASIGFLTYIKFLAMISVSLGVMNLLPVPMLDGGHLMYYIIEFIKGSPVSQKFEEMGQRLGLTLLLMLMSLAVFNDIQRLIN